MTTATHLQILTATECCACGMAFAVPENWLEAKRLSGASFNCPNGHSLSYGKGENQKLRDQLAKEKSARDQAEAAANHQAALRLQAETDLKKTKERIKGGKCPCCKRNFVALHRHIACKHPGYGEVKP